MSESKRSFYAKLEYENPTGSLKDRMVGYVINRLEKEGKIQKGQTIVEASSGNTGIALAEVCPRLGYSAVICCPKTLPLAKLEIIASKGAKVIQFDTKEDPEADIAGAKQYSIEHGAYNFNQFENPYCQDAYYHDLGDEVLGQLSCPIDYIIAGVGTGASLLGLGKKIKEYHKSLIYSVGPASSPTSIGGLHPSHIRGEFKTWAARPEGFLAAHLKVSDLDAWLSTELLNNNGFPAGPSSGAILHAAINLDRPGNYLLLFGDHIDRYSQ